MSLRLTRDSLRRPDAQDTKLFCARVLSCTLRLGTSHLRARARRIAYTVRTCSRGLRAQNRDLRSKLGLGSICQPLCGSYVATRYARRARYCEVHASYMTPMRLWQLWLQCAAGHCVTPFGRFRMIPGSMDISIAQRMHPQRLMLSTLTSRDLPRSPAISVSSTAGTS